jgi:hypothetical protein
MRWFGTIFGVRGDWGVARYERLGTREENEMGDAEGKEDNGGKHIYTGTGRTIGQRTAANLFASLGLVFYYTIPGINLNLGQSKLIFN